MKLHVLSDLHLSFCPMTRPDSDADVVVLAGDISRPEETVAWASGFRQPVIYVPGNHEFYGGSIEGTLQQLRRLCDDAGIHLLDGSEKTIDGVRFLGATLWTDFQLFAEDQRHAQAMQGAKQFMRDFARIRLREERDDLFTPDDSARLHASYRDWLEQRLAAPHDGPTVVVTHHAPSSRSIGPRFAGSPINAAFVSDLDALLDGERVALWIHGHTHDSFDYLVNGTRVVCNPRGYSRDGSIENRAFDPQLLIEV